MTLVLLDGRRSVTLDDVTSLVAGDASGQFGLQAGHADFLTVIEPGLFRYRRVSVPAWTFAACTGGLLACQRQAGGCTVRIVSGRFLSGDRPEALQQDLEALLAREQAWRVSARESHARLDLSLVRRLQQLAEERP